MYCQGEAARWEDERNCDERSALTMELENFR